MREMRPIVLVLLACALAACGLKVEKDAAGNDKPAEASGPQIAVLCVKLDQWPLFLNRMQQFGQKHQLKLIGGIEKGLDSKLEFNAALAQDYSYFFGDNLDLWFVSDPFREGVLYYNAALKSEPITLEQEHLAKALLAAVSNVSTPAVGAKDNPACN
ncbi:hypothetical protein [Sphingomonas qomolangmaensis]|uniref:Uncharacterized protein n=1 Tax=Sphingomonas qomolangmaensis TaxID=2918765 RepID=A0ABY5LCF2_9SPHN|nr:hypothetical protein [Sphingomonas qomolangmaensis]UUL83693.1 hypothetical protein NMP03_05680 [Sphingomonas qomolangmaensis]